MWIVVHTKLYRLENENWKKSSPYPIFLLKVHWFIRKWSNFMSTVAVPNNNYYFIFLTMALRGAVGFKLVFVDSMGSIRDNAISTSRTLLTVCPNSSDGWLRTGKHCPSIWKSLLDIVSRYSDQYQSVGIDKKNNGISEVILYKN